MYVGFEFNSIRLLISAYSSDIDLSPFRMPKKIYFSFFKAWFILGKITFHSNIYITQIVKEKMGQRVSVPKEPNTIEQCLKFPVSPHQASRIF